MEDKAGSTFSHRLKRNVEGNKGGTRDVEQKRCPGVENGEKRAKKMNKSLSRFGMHRYVRCGGMLFVANMSSRTTILFDKKLGF
jgi:hypothetical protein